MLLGSDDGPTDTLGWLEGLDDGLKLTLAWPLGGADKLDGGEDRELGSKEGSNVSGDGFEEVVGSTDLLTDG